MDQNNEAIYDLAKFEVSYSFLVHNINLDYVLFVEINLC
jgi:hypothetical protein